MGMDFTVYNLVEDRQQKLFTKKEVLYMRKPHLIAECCYLVAEGLETDQRGGYPPGFGPWPFTQQMLQKVLEMALEIEKIEPDSEWSFENKRRQEYIELWEALIKNTKDDWVIIEWIP